MQETLGEKAARFGVTLRKEGDRVAWQWDGYRSERWFCTRDEALQDFMASPFGTAARLIFEPRPRRRLFTWEALVEMTYWAALIGAILLVIAAVRGGWPARHDWAAGLGIAWGYWLGRFGRKI